MQNIENNVLGYYANSKDVTTARKMSSGSGEGFGLQLSSESQESGKEQTSLSAKAIAESYASKQSDLLDQIATAESLDDRKALALQYRDGMMDELKMNGFSPFEHQQSDKLILDGAIYDILGSLSTVGKKPVSQFMEVSETEPTSFASTTKTAPTRTADEVLYSTARQNQHLLDKINSATSLEERLGYAGQLRDTIADALNAAGHDAFGLESHDKLVINNNLYDIIYAVKGVGHKAHVQMLNHGPIEGTEIQRPAKTAASSTTGGAASISNPVSAIFSHGAPLAALMDQISMSIDLEERRTLGAEYQSKMVESMQSAGIDASAHQDPDKIVIGNAVFDVIQSLNSPGVRSRLQALRFA